MTNLSAVESIFTGALGHGTPAERAAYLDAACAGDAELRRAVERLLEAHVRAGRFLAEPSREATTDEPAVHRPGSLVGPYKLLEKIGEGGMGEVWVAEQQPPLRRRVALKLIKPGMDSRNVLARFEAERQALALMDHPNIAKVLDAGATPDGRPYFAMELVKGTPITEFCDLRKLTPRERLELFVPVCQAIQHAHQKGVIHRDIKPSNVLVELHDDRPVPKVIDFGVAKAVGHQLTEKTLYTGFGALVGTPAYMAPEQATFNALDVDTRADVYALGVVLYELLAGSPPFEPDRLKQAALDEVLRLVREEEPPRPSARLSTSSRRASIAAVRQSDPDRLAAQVRGELDWIVMKALEKDRGRRYESASGLARDVQRYLADEPVEACPPSLGYRVRKFVRKHRAPLATALVFVLSLKATTLFSLWQLSRANIAETVAEAERDEAMRAGEEADRQRDDAVAAREELRRTLYHANLNLLQGAWDADNTSRALELLDATRPGPGEADLRGFEWHYWDRQAHAELRRLKLDFGPPPARVRGDFVAFSADGSRCAALVLPGPATQTAFHVRAWDTADGREVAVVAAGATGAARIALSGDGNRLVVADEGKITVWDVASRKEVAVLRSPAIARPRRPGPRSEVRPALNHDGRRLAGFVQGGAGLTALPSVIVWDLDRGPEAAPVTHPGTGPGSALSPDGRSLATLALVRGKEPERPLRYELRILDAATGQVVRTGSWPTPAGPEPAVGPNHLDRAQLAFSPDGSHLAAIQYHRIPSSGAATTQGVVWDAQGKVLAAFQPSQRISYISFSPDGRRLATWTGERNAVGVVWDAATGAVIQTWKGHVTPVVGASFTAGGARALSVDLHGEARLWDAAVGPLRLPATEPNRMTAWSLNGARQCVFPQAGDNGVISVRDAAGRETLSFREHRAGISDVRLGFDGRHAVSIDRAGTILVWGTATGKVGLTLRWPVGGARPTPAPAFSGDGRRLAMNVPEGGVKVWDLESELRERFASDTSARRLVLSHDGRRLATVRDPIAGGPTREREVTVWDVETGARRGQVRHPIAHVSFSPDLRWFAGAILPEGTRPSFVAPLQSAVEVKVWDTDTGAERAHLKEGIAVGELAFSPDGALLATPARSGAPATGDVLMWDLTRGKLHRRLKGHTAPVNSLAFSPDGRRLASAAQSVNLPRGEVKIWDVQAGAELLALRAGGLVDLVGPLGFSPDGRQLFAAGRGSQGEWAQVWDATPRAVPASGDP